MGKLKEFIRKKKVEEDLVMKEEDAGGAVGGGEIAPPGDGGSSEVIEPGSSSTNTGLTQPEVVGTFDPSKGVLAPGNYLVPNLLWGYPVWRWKKSKTRRKKRKIDEATGCRIQGFETWREEDLISDIESFVNGVIEDYDLPIEIVSCAIHGSRGRGTARQDSDLDVVIEYKGDMKEDALWNLLNSDPDVGTCTIDGIEVDFNPINAEKSGSMEEYLERSRKYDDEVIASMKNDKK